MNKTIPLPLSLAQRLAAAQPETRFCGFCRTERAAVEELKAAMALSPTGRLPSQPALPGEPMPRPGQKLVAADFTEIEARVAAHIGTVDECDQLDQAKATIKEMGELIDQQAAEITRLKQNSNYMTEGCTCKRAEGIPREDV